MTTETPATDLAEAVRRFRAQHPDARVDEIDGRAVRGVCGCGTPVMQDSTGYRYDPVTRAFACAECAALQGVRT